MPHFEIEHSEEAQEIMGKLPNWIIRWGITLIFIILVGIVVGCYFIKYSENIQAPIILTAVNPPVNLIARNTGRIDKIYVQDNESVQKGEIIALLYSPADYEAICSIEKELSKFDALEPIEFIGNAWIEKEYILGEVQSAFLDLRQICLSYKYYLETNYISQKQNLLRVQIKKNHEYYHKQQQQKKYLEDDIEFEQKNTERDSILYLNDVISKSDYEQSFRTLLQKKANYENIEAGLTSTELEILKMEQQLIELSIEQDDEIANYNRQLSQAVQQLKVQIEQWKYQYVIIAPTDGVITFTNFWSSNQSIQTGERLATIIPQNDQQIIGRLTVPTEGFGKVFLGQNVNVKLSGYPYMEYGMLKGVVRSISEVPEEEGYIVEVSFPNGLVTTYRKQLSMIYEMDGTAEIITKDMRLIEQFIQPIRALFDE